MGALFTDLHDVAQVLSEHIREETGLQDVQPGAPREVTATTEPAARLTFLYATPQAGHRNDPVEPVPGGRRPPPLSLTCSYLLTTSGADADDPVGSHHALGQIMALYHDTPALRLPLSENPGSPPGAFSELGDGELVVSQVPMTLDQIDKVWTSLSEQLQPWALFDVGPVQLVSREPDQAPAGLVRPGGLSLEVSAGQRPVLLRTAPQPARPGGRVRLDVATSAAPETVWVAGRGIPAGSPALSVDPGSDPALATAVLDLGQGELASISAGRHPVTVSAGGLTARTVTLLVADLATALDAPATAPHDATTPLEITGAGLDSVQEFLAWPDQGVAAPSEVRSLSFATGGPGALTVPVVGGLDQLTAGTGSWRLAGRLPGQAYTPFVVLELDR